MLFYFAISAILYEGVGARCVQPNGANCPASCRCDEGEVKCVAAELNNVPDNLPSNVQTLDLRNNQIRRLHVSDLAGCTLLNVFNLSFNLLESVDKDVFNNTPRLRYLSFAYNFLNRVDFDLSPLGALETLDLSHNSFKVSRLSASAFRVLRSLETLDLTSNFPEKGSHYNEDLFIALESLKTLKIDGLRDEDFSDGFAQITQLKELSINGGLKFITNETFAVFKTTNLSKLSVHTGTTLMSIEPLSFVHLKRLKSLDLSENNNLTLKAASSAWFGLQFTQIEELRLNHVTPDSRTTEELDDTFFNYLNLTNITWLELKRNKLAFIRPVFSQNLPSLKHLDLTSNQLYDSLSLIDDLASLTNLQELWVGDQKWRSRQNDLQSIKSVSKRSLSSKDTFDFSAIEDTLECWNSMIYKKCQLEVDQRYSYSPGCIPLAPSLVEINLFGSLIVDDHSLSHLTITRGGANLQKIILGGNGLHQVIGPIKFANPPSTLVIDMSKNQMTCLHPNLFSISNMEPNFSVTELFLSENNLGHQLQLDVNGSTFGNYRFVTVLDLNSNGISNLNARAFGELKELQKLHLSRNVLRSIDFEFRHMAKLSLLDLSYNDILSLNSSQMQAFSEMFSMNSRLRLRLNGNPIQCTCDTLTFLHWVNQHRKNLDEFEGLSCFFLGEPVNFTRLQNHILVELDYVCKNSLAVIMSGTLLGLAIVLVAASAFCYRHRWEIRYGCIRLTQKGQRFQRLVNEAVRYKYDAFVVYDSRDHSWVNDELLSHLENDIAADNQNESVELQHVSQQTAGNLRLCVHERDFLPGEDILGNIWSKMEKSRKVIIVVSKNFTLSHYCEYEMNLARMLSVEQGRNVIVPIVLEMPDMDKVSDCLSWLMRKVTYIEWPQYEGDRDEFWYKLHETLADRE